MSILFNFPNFIDGNIFICTDWQCGCTPPRFIAHPWWFLWVTIKDLCSFSSWYMYLFLLYLQEFFTHKIKTSLSIFCLVVTMNKLILKALFFFFYRGWIHWHITVRISRSSLQWCTCSGIGYYQSRLPDSYEDSIWPHLSFQARLDFILPNQHKILFL